MAFGSEGRTFRSKSRDLELVSDNDRRDGGGSCLLRRVDLLHVALGSAVDRLHPRVESVVTRIEIPSRVLLFRLLLSRGDVELLFGRV